MAASNTSINVGFIATSPDGKVVKITRELFKAFEDFVLADTPPTGSVTVHFKNGGIAGVKAVTETVYK